MTHQLNVRATLRKLSLGEIHIFLIRFISHQDSARKRLEIIEVRNEK